MSERERERKRVQSTSVGPVIRQENYNTKRKRPLRSAITARALVTTSDINPRNFGEPSGPTLDGVLVLVGWHQIGILLKDIS